MKVDDRCKTTYQWFICTGINEGYLFPNPDRVRKHLIIYKAIYISAYSFSLEGEACPEQCRRGWDVRDIHVDFILFSPTLYPAGEGVKLTYNSLYFICEKVL